MPALPDSNPATRSLSVYVNALWGLSPCLAPLQPSPQEADVPPRCILSGRCDPGHDSQVLHVPLHAPFAQSEIWRQAAASHASAHWHFGGPPIPRGQLKLVQQALLGVLEDARVEWLAMQRFPGLRAVWLHFHAGTDAAQGNGFEALLARLAHSLLDPSHSDPHPWVAKARAVFFSTDGCTPALQTPEAVRQAASLLGADIGQMRLPFNARTYRVHAAYRDDNSHLWEQDDELPPSDTPLEGGQGASAKPNEAAQTPMARPVSPTTQTAGNNGAPQEADVPAADMPAAVYPEWDHVIGRYRSNWCQVFSPPLAVDPSVAHNTVAPRRLLLALADLQGAAVRSGGRVQDGDALHTDALVDTRIDQRLRQPPDPRIYQRVVRPAPPLAVMLLVDTSASTARPSGHGDSSLLDAVSAAALQASLALQMLGHRSAVFAFASDGRHRVDMPCLKAWDESAYSAGVAARMAALRSGGSTRLGAVLRHAVALCNADAVRHPGWHRVIVLVTDGEVHDIDVHHPAYLLADLKHAAQEAQRRGLAVRALIFPPGNRLALASSLGAANCAALRDVAELPQRLPALLGGLG